MNRRQAILTMGAMVAGAGRSIAAPVDDKLKVAIGGRGGWDSSVSELARDSGIFKKYGLDVDILYTQGSGESLQAVIAGAVDLGLALGTFGVLGAFAKGAPIRVIGSTMTGANDQYWYARADSTAHTGKDMAGRTVSYSTAGASTNAVVLGFAKTFGIQFNAVATGGLSATLTQVMSGQIDFGWGVVPFGMRELDEGRIRIISRANEVPELRNQSVRLITVNTAALQSKENIIKRFMAAYRETVEWMYASEAAVQFYAKIGEVSVANATAVREHYISRADVEPDRVDGLGLLMADAVGFKFLKEPLTEAQLSELILVPYR